MQIIKRPAAGQLKVYGIENLRIADGSIMPRVTTGNTMAPCMIIGERAAEVLAEPAQARDIVGAAQDSGRGRSLVERHG